MDPISGTNTIQEINGDHGIDLFYAAHLPVGPIQGAQWKLQLLD